MRERFHGAGRLLSAGLVLFWGGACGGPAPSDLFETDGGTSSQGGGGVRSQGGDAATSAGTKAGTGGTQAAAEAGTSGSAAGGGVTMGGTGSGGGGTGGGGSGGTGGVPLATPEDCARACAGIGECEGSTCVITCDAEQPCKDK